MDEAVSEWLSKRGRRSAATDSLEGMMIWRRIVLAGLFLISVLVLIGASGPFKALNQYDLSLVNPLEGSFGTGFTDKTLASTIGSIGVAHKALMLVPGTWMIANDLTIPANVE